MKSLFKKFFVLSTAVFVLTSMSIAEPDYREIKVFLLLGQSNMMGSGQVSELDAEPPGPRQDILYRYLFPSRPGEPEGRDSGSDGIIPLAYRMRDGKGSFGPELTLGAELKDRYFPQVDIVLLKFARGGTSLLDDWNPGGNDTLLYRRSLDYIRENLEILRNMGFHPEIEGAFWFQGEAESNGNRYTPEEAETYGQNLQDLVDSYRFDLKQADLPFVFARINPTLPHYTNTIPVREAIVRVASRDPNARWVDTDDLTYPDKLHVDGPGQLILGRRFASAWASLSHAWKGKTDK